jgi:hypothetical protein
VHHHSTHRSTPTRALLSLHSTTAADPSAFDPALQPTIGLHSAAAMLALPRAAAALSTAPAASVASQICLVAISTRTIRTLAIASRRPGRSAILATADSSSALRRSHLQQPLIRRSLTSTAPIAVHHESIFSSHKHAVVSPTTVAELEPQLAALFSTVAKKHEADAHPTPTGNPNAFTTPSMPSSPPSSSSSKTKFTTSAAPPPPPGTPVHPSYAHDLAAELLRTINPKAEMSHSVRIRNVMIALIGCFAIASAGVYIFRDSVKQQLSDQTADVAKRSLSSSEVQSQVNVLSAEVVRKLLNDPVIMSNCLGFLQTLFASPETKKSLIVLLQATIKDPETLAMLSKFSSELLKEIMAKPETLQQLVKLLRDAITEPGNERALQVLFQSFANDKKTEKMVTDLAKQTAMQVLNDPQVKEAAVAFIKSVTGDESVQQSTGDALWNTVKAAIRPGWFAKHGTPVIPALKGIVAEPEPVYVVPVNETLNGTNDAAPTPAAVVAAPVVPPALPVAQPIVPVPSSETLVLMPAPATPQAAPQPITPGGPTETKA